MFCKSEYKVGVANYFWFNPLGETTVFNKDCFHYVSQSGPWERAVDGRSWRAAGMNFWNKRHGFLTPIVSKVSQSGPWGRAVDGRSWRAAGMNFWNKWHGFLADCFKSQSERAVDGRPWRAAGMNFWNKRHGFLAPIVAEVRQSGPWEPAVDGRPWRAAETDFWNKRHGFLAPIVAEIRQSGPWTAGRDGPLGWTFETNGTASLRRLFQKSVRAGRGGRAVDGRPWRTAGTDFWNKWHGFLTPIVSKVCQSGPWWPWRDAGIDFWNKRHGFLLPIV